jgi:trk system potassium uptake protein TrkH
VTVRGYLTRRAVRHPVRIVPIAFAGAIALGTAALMLPVARPGPDRAGLLTALFTATSALCTTGLTVHGTPQYWSGAGHVIITVLTQLGGLGIVTMAMLLTLLVSRRLGLRNRLVLQAETARLDLGNAQRVIVRVALLSFTTETVIAVIVATRLALAYHYPVGRALWYGVFHAVQSFNNSGFSLFPDSIKGFVGDGWICLPLTLGVIVGATGFPVLFELGGRRHRVHWSVHTRLSAGGSLVLLALGFLAVLVFEWHNPRTLGPLDPPTKLLAAFVQGTIPRSGGLQSLDYGAMGEETTTVITGLMFIGGGSASTAGGIKVTTFFLLAFVIWAELRGEPDVVIGHRRIAGSTQRQALTVALLGVGVAAVGTLIVLSFTTGVRLYQALFEVVSAFSTAGISTGITAGLPAGAKLVLVVLMFVGRVGTITAASALALNTRQRLYRYPEERPIVG